MSVEDEIAELRAQMAEVLERVAQHGPEHDLEAVDPTQGRYQEDDLTGAPTHEAASGTRYHSSTDEEDYVNKGGGSAWKLLETGGAGAPKGADYLVGSIQGDLSAEIVVGTTPGGQLGGTWPSPKVDTVHGGDTGTSHHDGPHSLASHNSRPHSELSDAPTSAHHTKYTDAEAVTAVPYQTGVTFGWLQAPQRISP
jgi:hypothetical protein